MELVSGVWGHRLREVPRRRLCCFQCLHSIGFSVPVPATSRSGSHGASSGGCSRLACSSLSPPGILGLTVLSGGRSAYPR